MISDRFVTAGLQAKGENCESNQSEKEGEDMSVLLRAVGNSVCWFCRTEKRRG
jgi:hypothetical protein